MDSWQAVAVAAVLVGELSPGALASSGLVVPPGARGVKSPPYPGAVGQVPPAKTPSATTHAPARASADAPVTRDTTHPVWYSLRRGNATCGSLTLPLR